MPRKIFFGQGRGRFWQRPVVSPLGDREPPLGNTGSRGNQRPLDSFPGRRYNKGQRRPHRRGRVSARRLRRRTLGRRRGPTCGINAGQDSACIFDRAEKGAVKNTGWGNAPSKRETLPRPENTGKFQVDGKSAGKSVSGACVAGCMSRFFCLV